MLTERGHEKRHLNNISINFLIEKEDSFRVVNTLKSM